MQDSIVVGFACLYVEEVLVKKCGGQQFSNKHRVEPAVMRSEV